MSKMMSRRCSIMLALAVAAVLLLPLGVTSASAAETYEFKISLEGIPTHSKNLGVDIFVKELVAKSGGRLKPIVYHSAQLYKDMHVIKAVDMGMVQMAVVGNYLLDGVDINATVTHLPMFFGQAVPEDQYLRFLDEISKPVGRNLEKKIKVKVVGRVFVMGFDNTFTAKKKITKLEDFKGLKIRHAGGAVSGARFEALGAIGVVIAYGDLAMALTQHTIDGVATTIKSVESAKLHDAGLKYCTENRNFVSYYYPLVNLQFWNSLPLDLQKTFMEAWDYSVPKQREIAAKEQDDAKIYLQGKGMEFIMPGDAELSKWRNHIMPIQDKLIKDLKYDPEIITLCKKVLGM